MFLFCSVVLLLCFCLLSALLFAGLRVVSLRLLTSFWFGACVLLFVSCSFGFLVGLITLVV